MFELIGFAVVVVAVAIVAFFVYKSHSKIAGVQQFVTQVESQITTKVHAIESDVNSLFHKKQDKASTTTAPKTESKTTAAKKTTTK